MGEDRQALGTGVDARDSLDSRLLAAVDAAYEGAARAAERALDELAGEADVGVRFSGALTAVLEAAAAHPDSARLCLLEAPGLGASAVASKEAGLQRFVDLLGRELSRSGPRCSLVAEMVVGGVYEVVQRAVRSGDVAGLPALADELSRLWLPALRAH